MAGFPIPWHAVRAKRWNPTMEGTAFPFGRVGNALNRTAGVRIFKLSFCLVTGKLILFETLLEKIQLHVGIKFEIRLSQVLADNQPARGSMSRVQAQPDARVGARLLLGWLQSGYRYWQGRSHDFMHLRSVSPVQGGKMRMRT